MSKTQSSRWQRLAALDEDTFKSRLDRAKRKAINALDGTGDDKKQRRAEREKELAAKIVALPDKRYGVRYVDVAYRFEAWSRRVVGSIVALITTT